MEEVKMKQKPSIFVDLRAPAQQPEAPRKVERSVSCKESCFSCITSIRTTTIVVLILLFSLMFGAFLTVVLAVFIPSFDNLEAQTVRDAGTRVTRAIFDDISTLHATEAGYGQWDDSFQLAAAPTAQSVKQYVNSNFPASLMQSLRLNFVIYYYLNGSSFLSRTYDLQSQTLDSLQIPSFLEQLPQNSLLMANVNTLSSQKAVYVNHNNKVLLLITTPITTSYASAAPNGFILFGRYMTSYFVNNIAVRSQLCVSYHVIGDMSDTISQRWTAQAQAVQGIDINIILLYWANNNVFAMEPLQKGVPNPGRQCSRSDNGELPISEDRIAAFLSINGMYGKPAVIVSLDAPRYVKVLGNISIGVIIGVVALICIVVTVAVVVFIEFAVLHRMIAMSKQIHSISVTGDVSKRVKISGFDEIGFVTNNINEMLGELQKAQDQLKQEKEKLQVLLHRIGIEEERFRSINDAIHDFIITIDTKGVIIQANSAFHEKFQYPRNKTLGVLNITKVIPHITIDDISQVASSQQSREEDAVTIFGDTLRILLDVSNVKFFASDVEVDAFVIVARNMSEQKRLLESLELEKKKLRSLQTSVAFSAILKDPSQYAAYKRFCKIEHNEENILFLDAVDEYKGIKMIHERAAKQQKIIRSFLTKGGEMELNLANEVLENEVYLVKKGIGQSTLFDNLYDIIRTSMAEDSFLRFQKWYEENKPKSNSGTQDELERMRTKLPNE